MKATPLGVVLGFSAATDSSLKDHQHHRHHHQEEHQKWLSTETPSSKLGNFFVGSEKSSLLDIRRSLSPQPSSTLSSSLNSSGCAGASTDTTGAAGAAAAAASGNNTPRGGASGKCGMGAEDWEAVLPENGQEQSIMRMIMGDIEDPSVGLSKLLQGTGGSQELAFGAGFGELDQGFSFEPMTGSNLNSEASLHDCGSDFPLGGSNVHGNNVRIPSVSNPILFPGQRKPNSFSSSSANNALVPALPLGVFQLQQDGSLDEKPMVFDPQAIVNQNQATYPQNPSFFVPLGHTQMQDHDLLSAPPPKRQNSGPGGPNYSSSRTGLVNSGQDTFVRHQEQYHFHPQQFQTQRPVPAAMKQKMSDELPNHQVQQAIVDQLYKAVELIEAGNPELAQGILARLNHQLSPIGKPFIRAAFYVKEALQLLLQTNSTNPLAFSPFSLIYKIGAYKSFSEVSPVLQFANFTCNQAFLEALEGYDRVHILSFDVGYGGQWASLMQELALRNKGSRSLKITAFASPMIHDELELGLTQENLKHFANELNIYVEFEVVNIEALSSSSWPEPLNIRDGEAIAVNLPIASFSSHPSILPSVLRFIKQLSPKIVVSLDRSCDRIDAPFPQHVVQALNSYSSLLESLDALNVNFDVMQKIERYFLQPGIEKIIRGRHRSPEKTDSWRSLFLSSGFSPLAFSNFNESQAECLVQRTPVRGFHVEKRQHSLVLCWQRKELLSVSAWRY
ncbi:scarecrow-like protein 22 [Eucalyptus grandis]|uniref:scarecrow-like protein 22 n=1 Tax=Eucalyptus grandis TaxID=71139 RepID=UPI00192EB0AC|nr:scarecrow-like protein 22 [Eucalyptus grandis]